MTRVSTSECASVISKLVAKLEEADRNEVWCDAEVPDVIAEARAMLEKIRHE
jgi:hypothetical protein